MRFSFSLVLFLSLKVTTLFPGAPGSLVFSDNTFNDKIKTVQLFKEGWNLSYPIIKLGSSEKLILHFDLLGTRIETYYYTFIHCDKEWKKSDIFANVYIEGFPENPIEAFKPSFNTTVDYIHYKLVFPNDRVSLRLSGNYILYVYQTDDPDNPVLTRQFIITEDAVRINMNARRPMMTADNNTNQQIDFTVNYSGFSLLDPYRDIYSFILQNGKWSTAKRNLKPDLYGNNELKYSSLSENNIFPGGNEFRYFDIRSIRYHSEYVRKIDYFKSNYHVYLLPSENREYKPYFYWKDFNGKYYVAVQEGQDPETDADYVYVYFTLPSKNVLTGGRMFVSGSFNNWTYDRNNLMFYNPENESYECIILLKQGWYNYEYAFIKDADTDGFNSKFEGSHFETENDYSVIVYYRNPRDRYDRIIGAATINTLNRMSD